MKFQIKTYFGYWSFQPPDPEGFMRVQYRDTPGEYEQGEIIAWDMQQPLPPAPVEPEPNPPAVNPDADPEAIIHAVWATGQHELRTKEGCGRFTEACCTALHGQQSPLWGHIRKNPGQNQYNSHAVDAVMLMARAGATDAGIYDIIQSSESAEAAPIFLYKGTPDPELWFYPAPANARMVTDFYDAMGPVFAVIHRS